MYTLFVARGYPTDKYKTYGIFEFDQAKALTEQGCKVVYAAIDLRSIRRWRKWGVVKEYRNGVYIYSINIPLGKVSDTIHKKLSSLGLRILYEKIVKDHGKPDIIHAHFTNLGYIASKLKTEHNIPLVITEHSSLINKEKLDEVSFNTASAAYRKADALVAVSPSLADRIKNNFKVDPIYIPNIVDLDIFEYKGSAEREGFSFVSTGNLVDIKRMDLTIEAFYRAFRDKPKVSLTIFGDGPMRGTLENLIDKFSLESQVKLMGLASRREIAAKLSESNCFVLASQSETFGVAYVEALAMGLPVIATRCGGPEAFVTNKNGILVGVDNLEELTNAMKYMYANIDYYKGKDISEEIHGKFSARTISEKLLHVYSRILGKDKE